jgi:DNA primase
VALFSNVNATSDPGRSRRGSTPSRLELCPFVDEVDVTDYIAGRAMVFGAVQAGFAGLPPIAGQAALIKRLCETFHAETLALAGLVKCGDGGKPNLSRFTWPMHRLVIPWRSLDGSVQVLQRRRLDAGEPKYVFPGGVKPAVPFGIEALRRAEPERAVVFVEGAIDVVALRLLDARSGGGIVPLGIPGVSSWSADWARFAKGRDARIGFDTDVAGEDAVDAVASDLFDAGAKRVARWRPPPGAKDWAEALLKGIEPGRERPA